MYQAKANEICMPQECVMKDQPEIQKVFEYLQDQILRYENITHRLTDRISSVVTPEPPISTSDKKELNYNTSLAQFINKMFLQLREINDHLDSLNSRIEL